MPFSDKAKEGLFKKVTYSEWQIAWKICLLFVKALADLLIMQIGRGMKF